MTGQPRDYLQARGQWPDGPFRKNTPRTVFYAADISRAFAAAITENNMTKLHAAKQIGISRTTLYDILVGANVPDVHTIAEAEAVFGRRLWPQYISSY